MTRKNIAELAFMIGGVYMISAFFIGLIQSTGWVVSVLRGGEPQNILSTLGMVAILSGPFAILGVLLIRKADWFAARLVKGEEKSEQLEPSAGLPAADGTLGTSRLQAVLFSAVALFFIASAMNDLTQGFWTFIIVSNSEESLEAWNANAASASQISYWWIRGSVKLVIGLFIFFKAGSLSDWWHQLRGWDAYPAAPQTPQTPPEGNPE